jgi:hypothetical protein
VQHTSLTTVIDRKGLRRFNYLGEKWRLQDLETDVLTLLEKKILRWFSADLATGWFLWLIILGNEFKLCSSNQHKRVNHEKS